MGKQEKRMARMKKKIILTWLSRGRGVRYETLLRRVGGKHQETVAILEEMARKKQIVFLQEDCGAKQVRLP